MSLGTDITYQVSFKSPFYAEEYIGGHSNKLWTDDGRASNDMLPFFNTYLKFNE